VQNSHDQFDLIVFSLLDSHTTSSQYSNIRIDNYVYTVEALTAAKRLLRPDGVFIVKFQANTPWIAGRLYALLERVFGHPPVQLQTPFEVYSTGGHFFITGSEERLHAALAKPDVAAYFSKHSSVAMTNAQLTTDDWPYFYQHAPGLPLSVIVMSIVMIALSSFLVRTTASKGAKMMWHFFFLGAGFLLLEAQIVSKGALLFGTTWVVNSIVISALMLLIVAANFVVKFVRRFSMAVAYGGLFVTIAIGWFTPLQALLLQSVWMKAIAAALVLCSPVFFAGIIFVRSFEQCGFSGHALGSNLMGAVVGGVLESISFWTGIKSLLILAAILYAASALCLRRGAVTADERPANQDAEREQEAFAAAAR
jgi:hypothetical protein